MSKISNYEGKSSFIWQPFLFVTLIVCLLSFKLHNTTFLEAYKHEKHFLHKKKTKTMAVKGDKSHCKANIINMYIVKTNLLRE